MGREGRNSAVEIARQEKNRWKKRALNAEATLARVREWVEDPSKHQGDDYDKGLEIAEVILRAILDESPTKRETPDALEALDEKWFEEWEKNQPLGDRFGGYHAGFAAALVYCRDSLRAALKDVVPDDRA